MRDEWYLLCQFIVCITKATMKYFSYLPFEISPHFGYSNYFVGCCELVLGTKSTCFLTCCQWKCMEFIEISIGFDLSSTIWVVGFIGCRI